MLWRVLRQALHVSTKQGRTYMNAKHDLITELPEYKEQIHALKTNNAHFAKLFEEYHEGNKQVIRIEEAIETVSDEVAESTKKRRLQLKDELFKLLQTAA